MQISLTESTLGRFQEGLETARRLGATAARIAFNHDENTSCTFEAGRLKNIGGRESVKYSITVLVGNRKATTAGNRLEDLDAMIERAVTLAKVGSEAHFDAFPAPADIVPVKTHSDRTLTLTREQMIESCREINDGLKAYNPDLYIETETTRNESESILITTGGVVSTSQNTGWSLGGFAQKTDGSDILMTSSGRGWRDLNEFFSSAAVTEKIVEKLRRAEKIVEAPKGSVQAFIPPERTERMFAPLIMGIDGRAVFKGNSPLAGKCGERILSPSITVVDNPHVDFSGGAEDMDSDGVPTRKQALVEDGVLQRFLYDLDSAGLAGAEPTGNRGCSPYWTMLTPGERDSADMLSGIKDGLYILDLIGFGQGNLINGDFSCNVGLGYRIENGEIVGRVKDTMVSGNLYDLLKQNVELSSDTGYDGRYPAMVFDGLAVSA